MHRAHLHESRAAMKIRAPPAVALACAALLLIACLALPPAEAGRGFSDAMGEEGTAIPSGRDFSLRRHISEPVPSSPPSAVLGHKKCRAREEKPLTLEDARKAAKEVFFRHGAVLIDTYEHQKNIETIVSTLSTFEAGSSIPMETCVVLKADAYGHGLSRMIPAVTASGATYIGVVDSWEAIAARLAGWTGGIFRLRGAATSEVATMHDQAPEHVDMDEWLGDHAECEELNKLAKFREETYNVHLSFCKYMNRNAFQTVSDAVDAVREATNLCVRGLVVHMPTADSDVDATEKHIRDFFAMVEEALPQILKIREKHASSECRERKVIISWANSATVVRWGNEHPLYVLFHAMLVRNGWADKVRIMARPGHIVYGLPTGISYTDTENLPKFGFLDGMPDPTKLPAGGFVDVNERHVPSMRALMTYLAWSPAVRQFKTLDPVSVGYGRSLLRSYKGQNRIHTSLATLPVGYADGLNRGSMSNFGTLDVVYNEEMCHARVFESSEDLERSRGREMIYPGKALMVGPQGGGTAYVAGRVSMDMVVLDVSGLVAAEKMAGTKPAFFVFLGTAGKEEITPGYIGVRRNDESAEATIEIGRFTATNRDMHTVWAPLACGDEPTDADEIHEALLWRFFKALLATRVNGPGGAQEGDAGVAWEGVDAALREIGILQD